MLLESSTEVPKIRGGCICNAAGFLCFGQTRCRGDQRFRTDWRI